MQAFAAFSPNRLGCPTLFSRNFAEKNRAGGDHPCTGQEGDRNRHPTVDKNSTKHQNCSMKKWLKALFSETIFSMWFFLSALSTITTFFFPSLSGKPRFVSVASAMLGFAWGNFRVFQKQESRIFELSQAMASHDARTSQLRITPDNGSRYILTPVGTVPRADFNGCYLEFRLMVENTGRKNSTVNGYQVEIVDLQRIYPNVRPVEGRHGVHGRHCQYGMQPDRILSTTGNIRIEAESATNHGILLFFIPDITLEQFTNAGLRMQGENRKFGTLRCRLTLSDTTQSSAIQEFVLQEE